MLNKAKILKHTTKATEARNKVNSELASFFANTGRFLNNKAFVVKQSVRSDGKFKVSDGKFKITGDKFKVSDGKFKVTDGKFKVSDNKYKVTGSKFKVSDAKFKESGNTFNSDINNDQKSNANVRSVNTGNKIPEELKNKFMRFAAGFIYNADNYLHYSNNIIYDNDQSCTAIRLIDLATEASCLINKTFIIPLRKDRTFRNYGRFDEQAAGAFDGVIILYCGVPP